MIMQYALTITQYKDTWEFFKPLVGDCVRRLARPPAWRRPVASTLVDRPTWLALFGFLCFQLVTPPAEAAFVGRPGVRALGMGGAFVAQADDASAGLWNPAGLAQLKQAELVANYSALHTGLGDDNLGRSYLGYTHPIGAMGALGVNLIRLQTPLYSETTAGLSYSHRFNFLHIGGSVKGLFGNFEENEYTEKDPLFQEYGRLTEAVSFDLGVLLRLTDALSLGVALANLNEPNLALEDGQEDLLPREIKAGVRAKLSEKLAANLDFTWRDMTIRDRKDTNLHLGLESWLTDEIGFRAGANYYDLTAGASYRFNRPSGTFQLDYAFNYPMPFEIGDDIVPEPLIGTTGTHQFALSVGFSSFGQLFSSKPAAPSEGSGPAPQIGEFLEGLDADEIESSLPVYQQAVQRDKMDPDAHFELAQVYTKLNQYDDAVQHLKQAIKISSQRPAYHYTLADVYEQYGDATGRSTWYNKAKIELERTRMLDTHYGDIDARIKHLSHK